MDTTVKMWQMILTAIGTIIAVATIVYKSGGNDAEQNVKIEYMQRQINEITVNMTIDRKESKERDDRILNTLMDVRLLLQDKQDKKK